MKLRLEYESIRSSLLNRSPVPSLDICFGELLREERLSTQAILEQSHGSSKTTTMTYAAQGRGSPMTSKNLQCFCCKEYGHIAANCPKKYCSYCKKKGHIIKECRIRPQNRQAQAFETFVTIPPVATSVAQDSSSGASSDLAPTYCTPEMVQQMLILALSAMGFQGKHSTTLWYVDSGVSNHMTNTPTNLSHVRPYAGQFAIHTDNGNSLPIVVVGNASSTFTDVFLAPQLSTNLIYVGQLVDNNCAVNFSSDGCVVQDQVDLEEVMYLAKELWHGRSAREQSAKDVGRGMWRSVNELMLVRVLSVTSSLIIPFIDSSSKKWDRMKPACVSNLILLKFKEADEHESRTLDDIKEKEPEFFKRVTSVLKRAELDFGL
ncbi:hypothetical protein Patl1_20938 [Pistacia atlantica]|uniref:Uncharacterized protein n=1 Tax=Pistacia atlantica TaxID=434234 RepID=A0ACC1BJK8_9ROSI|nr:hypothetical protein Patl1_20938 [Pistacia atlantica]